MSFMKFIKQTLRNTYVNNIGEPDQERGKYVKLLLTETEAH